MREAVAYLVEDVVEGTFEAFTILEHAKGAAAEMDVALIHPLCLLSEADRLRESRKALTVALTNLTCGGSEFFKRDGEEFIADADACVAYVNERRASTLEALKKEKRESTRLRSLDDENKALREALGWYGEQARLCRLIHSEGDVGRHALSEDGGKKAKALLQIEERKAGGEPHGG